MIRTTIGTAVFLLLCAGVTRVDAQNVASMSDGGGPIPIGVVTGMMVFRGMGAAAGAGIDALITRRQVIYEKPGGGGQVSVSPLFLDGRRGVAVSVTF
jgi:hypothetical protein